MELKDSEYQSGLKLLGGVQDALQGAMAGCRRREEHSTLRRRIEELEMLLKKVKRQLRLS